MPGPMTAAARGSTAMAGGLLVAAALVIVAARLPRALADDLPPTTTIRINGMSQYLNCGLYSVKYQFWSDSALWSFASTECSAGTTNSLCYPTTTPNLVALECINVLSCEREVAQVSDVAFCLVMYNQLNRTATVELSVLGSYKPQSSSGDGGGLSTWEIILICVGGGCGLVMLVALGILVAWLCCRRPPSPKVQPYMDDAGTFGPKSMGGAMPMSMGGGIAPMGYPMSMGGGMMMPSAPMMMGSPQLMAGKLTILPPGAGITGPVTTGTPLGPASAQRAQTLPPLPQGAYGASASPHH